MKRNPLHYSALKMEKSAILTRLKFLVFIIVFIKTSFLLAGDIDQKVNNLITGMYELETWLDDDKIYEYPDVTGTLSINNGQIGFTLDNRINKNKTVKVIGWGNYILNNNEFKYQYTDFKVLILNDGEEIINDKLPWEGYRVYDLKLQEDVLLLSANNGNQTWKLDTKNLVYTDKEWGADKKFAQRIWKRITN